MPITKWIEASPVQIVSSGTTRVELATQVGFPLQQQMEHPSPDPCREGSPRGWAVDKGVTGANSLLIEHQRGRAVGQGVFSVRWSLMLGQWHCALVVVWF